MEYKKNFKKELFDLFILAKELYIQEVIQNNMRPECFIELFYDSHYYIDCQDVLCKNMHRTNLGIIRQVFRESIHLVKNVLLKDDFSIEKLETLLAIHQRCNIKSEMGASTLGCRFSSSEMDYICNIAKEYNLFCTHEHLSMNDIIPSLLNGKKGFSVAIPNIKNVSVFFDTLLECRLINNKWQSALGKNRSLISAHSGKIVSASALSSALHRVKTHPTASQLNIRKSILDLYAELQTKCY